MLRKTSRAAVAALLAGGLIAAAIPVARAQGTPPHAWLFGTWAGGILPAPAHMTAADCVAHASFEVTQDVVMHSTLVHPAPIQQLIVSVRGTPKGTIIMLAPPQQKAPPLAGVPQDLGFGCPQPNVLRVVRVGPNEIRLDGCAGFPSPLVRCG